MAGNPNAHPAIGRDAGIIRCGRPATDDHVTLPPGSEGQFMFERYMQFYAGIPDKQPGIIGIFVQDPNVPGSIGLEIIWSNLAQFVTAIVDVAKGIIALASFSADGVARAGARRFKRRLRDGSLWPRSGGVQWTVQNCKHCS